MDARDEAQRVLESLREAIRDAGLSQRKVERMVGFSRGYLSQLLARNLDLKYWHVMAILDVIELRPERFFAEVYPTARASSALEVFRDASEPLSDETGSVLDRLYGQQPAPVQELCERLERCERAISELEAKVLLGERP